MVSRSLFAPDQVAAVEVDPDLLLLAMEDIASRRPRPRDGVDVIATCAAAYVEHIGLEAEPGEDALSEADILVIIALASRVTALSGLLDAGHLDHRMIASDPGAHQAMAEAACSATLLHKGERPVFQLLDFVAHLERAERGGGSW